MPNYKETSTVGTQWQRCSQVIIDNPLGQTPTIIMREESVVTMGADTFIKESPGLSFPFDPAETIALLDPDTGEPLGASLTFGELYVALWSVYIHKARARDDAALPAVD